MIRMAISSYIVTFGFGVLFNIHGKKLFYAPFGASIGSIVYLVCKYLNYHYFISLLLTAVVFSLYAELMSRKLKTPVTLFVISATICFVPGGLMYNTMAEIIKGNMDKSLALGFEALASAGALALGIMIASTIIKIYFYVKQRMN